MMVNCDISASPRRSYGVEVDLTTLLRWSHCAWRSMRSYRVHWRCHCVAMAFPRRAGRRYMNVFRTPYKRCPGVSAVVLLSSAHQGIHYLSIK